MTENEWLSPINLYNKLNYVESQYGTNRLLRLFACACCRRVWNLLSICCAKRVVEMSEKYADGQATESELLKLHNDDEFVRFNRLQYDNPAEIGLTFRGIKAIIAVMRMASLSFDPYMIAQDTSRDPALDFLPDIENQLTRKSALTSDSELVMATKFLWDIFGNPFQPTPFAPAWRTQKSLNLSRHMYDSNQYISMKLLGDYLEEAGCDNIGILNHCRLSQIHVRGCWVVDLVLQKR